MTECVVLRAETAADADFLYALFRCEALRVLALADLPEPVLEQLVAMQQRAQTQSYRAHYPQARRWVVELDGVAIGRLVEADQPGAIYIVDIAILPEAQGQGLGARALRPVLAEAGRRGLAVRAKVRFDNRASLALFDRLGFRVLDPGAIPMLDLERPWPEPACGVMAAVSRLSHPDEARIQDTKPCNLGTGRPPE